MLGYAEGSIAGIALVNAGGDKFKAIILDGNNLQTARVVNSRVSAGGELYTQTIALSSGIPFGVKFDFIDTAKLQSIITAINTALDAQTTFNVTLQDDIQSIDVDAVVAASDWLKDERGRTNPITSRNVTMRFLSA